MMFLPPPPCPPAGVGDPSLSSAVANMVDGVAGDGSWRGRKVTMEKDGVDRGGGGARVIVIHFCSSCAANHIVINAITNLKILSDTIVCMPKK